MINLNIINLLTILGHTAGGKTAFAARMAYETNGEIISADSRQVYRNMNLGTGKDYQDYLVNDTKINYHLIDIREPGEEYNVFEFQKDFLITYKNVINRNKLPVLCGGSGLYIQAALKKYKLINVPENPELRQNLSNKNMKELITILQSFKELHNTTDTTQRKRLIRAIEIEDYYSRNPEISIDFPEIKPVILGIKFDRDARRHRITQRLKDRLESGMIEEAKKLHAQGVSYEKMEYYGLEYKYLAWYLTKRIDYNELFENLNTSIHQFAKRQMTWFRRMERQGMKIHWLDGQLTIDDKVKKGLEILEKYMNQNSH